MADSLAKVLLIVSEPELRDVNALVLIDANLQVEQLPDHADSVAVAEQSNPAVIVISLRPMIPQDRQIVEDLQRNPRTRVIPIVVISTDEQEVRAVAALPNVRGTIVTPYDIAALENAVAAALGKPLANGSSSEHLTWLRLPT